MSKYISFIETESLRPVADIDELQRLVDYCRANNKPLANLDLSGLDINNFNFERLEIKNVVFNYYDPEVKERKTFFNLSFKGSHLNNVALPFCRFERCNFDSIKITKRELVKKAHATEKQIIKEQGPTLMNEVDFFFSEFDTCRFRRVKMNIADFRYSRFIDCSLGDWDVTIGDFYMAYFGGTTNFNRSKFRTCSLTYAIFEQNCPDISYIDRLAQEDSKVFGDIIIGKENWSKHNPCADFSHVNEGEDDNDPLKSKIEASQEAQRVYATLSGIYNGKGLYRESNEAYGRAKDNEIRHYRYSLRKNLRDFSFFGCLKDLGHLTTLSLSWLFGYGYKVPYVIFIFLGIVWACSVHFRNKILENSARGIHVDGVVDNPDYLDSFAHSLNNSMGPHSPFYDTVGLIWGSLETVSGILLIGFLGFIMANRIRNNA